jgi:PilZ domain
MDESSFSQNRGSNRSPVLLSAKVEVDGAQVPVILRNLSSQGALIEGADLPCEGATTTFHRNDLSVQGRVAWVEGRYAGIAFDRQLDPDELLRHVPKPRQRVEPQFRRPGLACAPLSEADRKMIQMWAPPAVLREV